VYELQLLLGAEARLAREGEPPQLGEDASVAELLHVVDVRYAPHHLLAAELPQGLKVEVPKALVPSPSVVVAAGYKTKRLCHLCVKDVEAVAPIDVDQEPVSMIPDAQDPVLDLI
jgi:hypothetical protein